MAEIFTPAEQESRARNWTPFVVGLVAVVVVVGVIVVLAHRTGKTAQQVNPYVPNFKFPTRR